MYTSTILKALKLFAASAFDFFKHLTDNKEHFKTYSFLPNIYLKKPHQQLYKN